MSPDEKLSHFWTTRSGRDVIPSVRSEPSCIEVLNAPKWIKSMFHSENAKHSEAIQITKLDEEFRMTVLLRANSALIWSEQFQMSSRKITL